MTGTPLDLTPFGAVLKGVGLLYWLLVLGAIALVIWKVRSRSRKLISVAAILAVMVGPMAVHVLLQNGQQQQVKTRLNAATAHFAMKCKTAGEKINRIIENVEGVVWIKWREKVSNKSDQFKLNDPYGHDCGGEDCILKLLRATSGLELDPQKKEPYHTGYRFVESTDPQGAQLYRYTLRLYRPYDRDKKWLETLIRPELVKVKIEKHSARYGITWDDVSAREDRELWIAGGTLKVIDLQTNEVIAEQIGYMMDRGLGSTEGFRAPWGAAPNNACPDFPKAPGGGPFLSYRADNFIRKILKPEQ